MEQTSPGTLYFFITIPVSQSITQRESPPQVATKRLPPPAPVQKRLGLFLFSLCGYRKLFAHLKLFILIVSKALGVP